MAAVSVLDLFPQAFSSGLELYGFLSIIVGMGFVYILSVAFKPGKTNRLIRAGILAGITIAIHNFPEGLAIGSGFSAGEGVGAGIALVIMLHDLPEGMAMAAPLRAGGMDKRAIWLTLLAGVPTGLGAIAGYALGSISPFVFSLCMGFAGGAMIQATFAELIPESIFLGKGYAKTIFGGIVGLIAGSIIVILFK